MKNIDKIIIILVIIYLIVEGIYIGNNFKNVNNLESRIEELENQNYTLLNHTTQIYNNKINENPYNDNVLNNSLLDLQEQINILNQDVGYCNEFRKNHENQKIEEEEEPKDWRIKV